MSNITMRSRTLELRIISCEDLRISRHRSVDKNAYAVVRVDSRHESVTTKVDKDGGPSPYWDEKFVVELAANARFINVEVRRKDGGGGKFIGAAKIPVSDFTGGFVPENYLHCLSYRLRDASGERNGIVNLTVRVLVPEYVDGRGFVPFSGGGGPGGHGHGSGVARSVPYGM